MVCDSIKGAVKDQKSLPVFMVILLRIFLIAHLTVTNKLRLRGNGCLFSFFFVLAELFLIVLEKLY